MAQIIKHRRGSIGALKDVTARTGEIVMATGSVGDLNGPWTFIGNEDSVGAYRTINKIYEGSTAPTLTIGSVGTVLNGTPFYAGTDRSLYVLDTAGNRKIDLTGNIEGNTITNVTITALTGSTAILSGNITADSANITNNITVGGVISGSTSIITNNLTVNGTVSSSLEPNTNNVYDLGSETNAWKDLYVSGTAYVGNLVVDGISFDGDLNLDNLTVAGDSQLGNELTDTTTISGTLNLEGNANVSGNIVVGGDVEGGTITATNLTEGRVVVVGADGQLVDYGDLIYDTTKLQIGGGALEIDNDGDIRTTGSLIVTSTTELKGNTGINGTLDVTGSVQLKSTLDVDGQATFSSANVEDLTDGRIVLAGVSGELQDSSDLVFNGTVLQVGGGVFEVDVVDGDIRTSGSLTVDDLNVDGDLTVNGNVTFLGGATEVIISSSTVLIDDNIITLNAFSPFERYAGVEVIDSGSTATSASLLWDSQNDYWLFMSSSGQTSKLIGTTAGTFGSEIALTVNTIPKATGVANIGDSLLTDNGTTLAYNTNVFTVTASTGATSIAGNVTLTAAGGADAGSNTSTIVFRNSSNVLGFVSGTETTDVMDGILGYKSSDGALVFSTVIDGGTY